MAWISSISRTVLPTPAPPNIAALPPKASGTSRSITLMPVSNTVAAAGWLATGGGGRGNSPGGRARRSGEVAVHRRNQVAFLADIDQQRLADCRQIFAGE